MREQTLKINLECKQQNLNPRLLWFLTLLFYLFGQESLLLCFLKYMNLVTNSFERKEITNVMVAALHFA